MGRELDDALERLPHGEGFRFVDEVRSLDPGREGRGVYRVRGDEPILNGHFPGNPITPGVILIEAIAQLGGVVAQTDPEVPPLADLRLAAVKSAKILGAAGPGELLEIHVRLDGRMGGLVQLSGGVSSAGRELARASVCLSGVVAETA